MLNDGLLYQGRVLLVDRICIDQDQALSAFYPYAGAHRLPALQVALVGLVRQPVEAEPFAVLALDADGFAAAVLMRADAAIE
ncbi:hypothetical protein ACRQ5Q_24410 [Bradyrhizobium sp. PMVTL-01]|uniref:hypothetical protein n=1 Tax=Bradyrhizobium sp. PMVTL-01 TaxID=3434999 RepID=UPI003F6E75D0